MQLLISSPDGRQEVIDFVKGSDHYVDMEIDANLDAPYRLPSIIDGWLGTENVLACDIKVYTDGDDSQATMYKTCIDILEIDLDSASGKSELIHFAYLIGVHGAAALPLLDKVDSGFELQEYLSKGYVIYHTPYTFLNEVSPEKYDLDVVDHDAAFGIEVSMMNSSSFSVDVLNCILYHHTRIPLVSQYNLRLTLAEGMVQQVINSVEATIGRDKMLELIDKVLG